MERLNKVVVFTTSCVSIPVIELLASQNRLAGVVTLLQQELGEHRLAGDLQQLRPQLVQANIPQVDLNDTRLLAQFDYWQASAGLVFGFSHKIEAQVCDYFEGDIFNLHASDLPVYRGSNPIYWQLRDNLTRTQLTLHRLTQQMDSGEIGLQSPLVIHPFDNHQSFSLRVMQAAPQLVADFIAGYEAGAIEWRAQQGEVSLAPRVNADNAQLSWSEHTVADFIGAARAGNPHHGGVAVHVNGGTFNVMQISASSQPSFGCVPGTVLAVDKGKGLIVAAKDGAVSLDVIVAQSGYYSGYQFAVFYQLDAGMILG